MEIARPTGLLPHTSACLPALAEQDSDCTPATHCHNEACKELKKRKRIVLPCAVAAATAAAVTQGKPRREVDALSREITLAAAAAAAAREQAGGSLAGTHQQGVTSVVVGHKRPRPGSAGAAAAPTPEAAKNSDEAVDALLAKIVSGALWPRPQAGTR